jgi:hypothetical protein
MSRRDIILATVRDLAADFLYYDRKEDEELPVGAIEEAVVNREIMPAEMAHEFFLQVHSAVKSQQENTKRTCRAGHVYVTEAGSPGRCWCGQRSEVRLVR